VPYDPAQAAEQRQMERESKAREAGATKSPMKSSGGGGFQSNAPGSGSANAAPAPGDTDGGLSTGVIHSGAMEQNIHDKAIGGGIITNDDLSDAHSYLGHFAGDSVLTAGHNAGKKKTGKAPLVRPMATRGYRKLPGSASPQQGHAMFGTMSEQALGLRPNRAQRMQDAKMKASMTRASKRVMLQDPFPLRSTGSSPGAVNKAGGNMPPTTANKKLSIKHETDRVNFNLRHARDHMADAKAARKKLAAIRKSKPPRG
jgi:hypothetical protein